MYVCFYSFKQNILIFAYLYICVYRYLCMYIVHTCTKRSLTYRRCLLSIITTTLQYFIQLHIVLLDIKINKNKPKPDKASSAFAGYRNVRLESCHGSTTFGKRVEFLSKYPHVCCINEVMHRRRSSLGICCTTGLGLLII